MPYDDESKPDPEPGLDEPKEEEFSFLQETIKPKTITRRKILTQLARVGIYGLLFGTFTCLGFFALKPWAQKQFQGNPETVTIPKEEETQTNQEQQAAQNNVTPPTLDADSYKTLMKSVYQIATEADKCVTFIRRSNEGTAVSGNDGITQSVTGLVVADNGQELLILCDNSICSESEKWNATFADNSQYEIYLKKQDKNNGFAVFGIPRAKVSDSTWSAIKVAELGNSNIAGKGDPVIALGNTFGYANGVGYGIISSSKYKETLADAQRGVLTTDIAAESGGTGVLFNLNGQVIGMIDQGIWDGTKVNTAKALGISDLKSTIELLVNGQSVPYVGVYGTTISETLSKEQELPVGVYVTKIKPDSPAMAAGIQTGDILQEVAGTRLSNTLSYENAVIDCKVGDSIKVKAKRRGAGGYVDIDFTVTVGSQE